MNYNNITLFALGFLGILLHNLIELNKINRASNGTLNILKYLALEVYSIFISILVVIVAIIVKQEVKQLELAGKWIGIGFVAIGYMGQSLLVFVMGKAQKFVEKEKPDPNDPA